MRTSCRIFLEKTPKNNCAIFEQLPTTTTRLKRRCSVYIHSGVRLSKNNQQTFLNTNNKPKINKKRILSVEFKLTRRVPLSLPFWFRSRENRRKLKTEKINWRILRHFWIIDALLVQIQEKRSSHHFESDHDIQPEWVGWIPVWAEVIFNLRKNVLDGIEFGTISRKKN